MLRITENKDEIIIREIPVLSRINAGVVMLILAFVIPVIMNSIENTLQMIFFTFFYLSLLGGFIFYLLKNPSLTVKINKPGQTVSVRKQSLIRYNFNVYSFNEMAGLIYVDGIGSKTVQLMMPLKDGRKIELSITDGSSAKQCFDAASLLNSYVFDTPKQISYKPAIFEND